MPLFRWIATWSLFSACTKGDTIEQPGSEELLLNQQLDTLSSLEHLKHELKQLYKTSPQVRSDWGAIGESTGYTLKGDSKKAAAILALIAKNRSKLHLDTRHTYNANSKSTDSYSSINYGTTPTSRYQRSMLPTAWTEAASNSSSCSGSHIELCHRINLVSSVDTKCSSSKSSVGKNPLHNAASAMRSSLTAAAC